MAMSLSAEFQNIGLIKGNTKYIYASADGGSVLFGLPTELPLENMIEEVNPETDSNAEQFFMFSDSDDVVPQPVEVVIDGCGLDVAVGPDEDFDCSYRVGNEIYLRQLSPSLPTVDEGVSVKAEVVSALESPLLCNRRGERSSRATGGAGSRSKCKIGTSNDEDQSRNGHLSFFSGDYSLTGWSSGKRLNFDQHLIYCTHSLSYWRIGVQDNFVV